MATSEWRNSENHLKCIFFGEFHDTAGPRISFQVPEDYISKDAFDALRAYIISKPQLREKIMTVSAAGHKIIGYPVNISGDKFPRGEFIFNLCFVCDEGVRTVQYEPVVKKLANYFITMEMESGFLSNESNKDRLIRILKQVLHDLNMTGHCVIPIDEANTIHLRVVRVYPDPAQVEDYHVPLFTVARNSLIPTHWDLTTQQILPYIDGFNHVAKIAAEADVEISLVKACIQNMVYYGVVTLIPIFQYSNVYTVTPSIRNLAENHALQEECMKYVGKNEHQLPTFRDVFSLYCALSPGTTIRDVCTRHNPHSLKIDERKLIQFGMMKGFIRRLYKFPILIGGEEALAGSTSQQKPFKMYLDGLHHYDDICCKTGMNYQELDEKVDKDPGNVVICWK